MNNNTDTNKDKKRNNEEHSISHMLITLCLLICLACLFFSVNTFFLLKNHIDVETGRKNIANVRVIEPE